MASSDNARRFHDGITRASRIDWILIVFACLGAFAVSYAVIGTLGRIDLQIKTQIADSLQTVVATTREGIELWVSGIKDRVSVLAQRPEVESRIEEQLKAPMKAEALRNTLAIRGLRQYLTPVLEVYEYDFAVVNRDGIAIAARSDEEIGRHLIDRENAQPIQAALNGEVAFRLSSAEGSRHEKTLIVASPVKDSRGHIIAALVLFSDPIHGFRNLTQPGRIGETGETYIFDRFGRIIAGSRLRPDQEVNAGSEQPTMDGDISLTRMAQRALAGESGIDVEGYRDYRGDYVFGAWSWDRGLNLGIATEVDQSEAMAPYQSIRALTLWMLSIIGLSIVALSAALIHRARILASNYAFRQAVKARQDTLAIVSHDLRSPLSNVVLCSNMISGAESNESQRERLTAVIKRSASQMEKLIADLLDVSEMERGHLKIEKKECDVSVLLDMVTDTFAEEARSRTIDLSISNPQNIPPIHADADRIVQALSNLVGNALKFTPENGRVSVDVTPLQHEAMFSVRDTGPGISDEELPHIFEQFWKANGSGKKGKGLGLYIARMIVEQHGGRIWAERTVPIGSAFFFTIPY